MSDVDRYQYGYDQNSNRLFKANTVGTPMVSGGLDEYYTYDNLNRLTVMQRGTLNTGRTGIAGTPVREMDYTLDPTGNWTAYVTKTNGTTDLSQTRTANTVNEITAIGGTPGWATPPAYDAAGNMTSFPQPASPTSNFTATYDAWNRMVSINTSGGSVATYQYDGRGRRIVKNTASISEIRHFYYTSSWQDIEERIGSSTSMDKQYVCGLRYVDELVCRDDATPERLYAMQDANFSLTSISGNTSSGVLERYRFDPYGNRTIMNGSWGVISSSAYSWAIGHQGLMQDEESSFLYCRSRYLHELLFAWLVRDGPMYADGVNLYSYLRLNPVTNIDPLGRDTTPDYTVTTPWQGSQIVIDWKGYSKEALLIQKVVFSISGKHCDGTELTAKDVFDKTDINNAVKSNSDLSLTYNEAWNYDPAIQYITNPATPQGWDDQTYTDHFVLGSLECSYGTATWTTTAQWDTDADHRKAILGSSEMGSPPGWGKQTVAMAGGLYSKYGDSGWVTGGATRTLEVTWCHCTAKCNCPTGDSCQNGLKNGVAKVTAATSNPANKDWNASVGRS